MTRKRKKKNAKTERAMEPGTRRRTGMMVVVAVVLVSAALVVGAPWFSGCQSGKSTAPAAAAVTAPDAQVLKGQWQRPDGGYVVDIKAIAADGAMEASYFNPKSIHVAKAATSVSNGTRHVFIELRDVNYPGSTYTLVYEPTTDQLNGLYYQAALKQTYEVYFVRMKP